MMCLPMVVVAVTIQLVFSEELITNHKTSLSPDAYNRDSICWIPWKYSLSAVTMYALYVCVIFPCLVRGEPRVGA